jgi:N-acetyl-anhydromuramyl-L-alanine amidase AmpD
MAGSREPGPQTGIGSYLTPLDDGTNPRWLMQGAGAVGTPGHLALAPDARTAQAAKAAQAAQIDKQGVLIDARVVPKIAKTIERGPMAAVSGIIVHQTGGGTAQSSLDSYKHKGANGAHFLIDKDGTLYQTASLYQRTWHVGKLRARCLVEQTCTPTELKAYSKFDPTGMHQSESAKAVPSRYPSNEDAVGIELVGRALEDPKKPKAEPVYESVTKEQNASLQWLVAELSRLLAVPMTEVFRHPEVSRKNASEAATAVWR